MTRYILGLALTGSLLLAACSQGPAQDAPDDLAAIAKIRTAYAMAMEAGDATAIGNLYTEDGISQTNYEATMVGRAAIVEGQKKTFADAAFSGMEITPEETHTFGTMGYERGRYKLTFTLKAGGAPTPQAGRYMLILQKDADGMWKVARDMDNAETRPAPPPVDPAK